MKYSHIKRTMIGCIIVLSALSAGPAAALVSNAGSRQSWNLNLAEHSQQTYKQHSKGGGCGPVDPTIDAGVPCIMVH